jgi:hypothetical protein
MKRLAFFAVLLLGGILMMWACADNDATSGDGDAVDGDEPSALLSFDKTDCNQTPLEGARPKRKVMAEATDLQDQALNGLRCVRWSSHADQSLSLDLLNFSGACCAEYDGSAELTADGLLLALVNTPCEVCLCGACNFSWAFTVAEAATGADLVVTLSKQNYPCEPDMKAEVRSFSLPLTERDSGMICRYEPYMYEDPDFAALHQPCNSGDGVTPCEDGLSCYSDPTSDTDICVLLCESDTDCPLTDLQSCQEGVCLLDEILEFAR